MVTHTVPLRSSVAIAFAITSPVTNRCVWTLFGIGAPAVSAQRMTRHFRSNSTAHFTLLSGRISQRLSRESFWASCSMK